MLAKLKLYRHTIDTVPRRLVRHEANVAICDRVVACWASVKEAPDAYLQTHGYMIA